MEVNQLFSEDFVRRIKLLRIYYLAAVIGSHFVAMYFLAAVVRSQYIGEILIVSLLFWILSRDRILVPNLSKEARKELDRLLDQI